MEERFRSNTEALEEEGVRRRGSGATQRPWKRRGCGGEVQEQHRGPGTAGTEGGRRGIGSQSHICYEADGGVKKQREKEECRQAARGGCEAERGLC